MGDASLIARSLPQVHRPPPPAHRHCSRPPPCMQPGAVVGRKCPTCPRGVFASKSLNAGDVILRVPLTLALPVR